MNRFQHLRLLFLLSLTILVSGCGLRPQETTIYVVCVPGTPLRVLESKSEKVRGQDLAVRGQDLKSGKIVENQKINGWVTMPPEHWDVVKQKLNGVGKYESDHGLVIPPLGEIVK